MIKIKNFMYCISIEIDNGRRDLNGVLSAITPEYIPGLFSFSIYFSILGLDEGEHSVTIKFKDSDDNIIASIENGVLTYKKNADNNLPVEYSGINVAAGFQNVELKKSGLYSTQVVLDGDDMGTYEIFVKGKNEQ